MLLAISKYIKPLEEVDLHRSLHIEFLKTLLADKKILFAGRQNPPVGAVIVSNLQSKDTFKQLLDEDPYAIAGVATYNIIEFTPTLYDAALAEILS